MTLGSNPPYSYTSGNGITKTFTFDFRAFLTSTGATGIEVSIENNDPSSETYGELEVVTEGVEYSVTLDADPDDASQTLGGTVEFVTAPTALQNVLILSKTDLTQQKDYSGGGTFPAASHEDAIDKITRVNQEQQLALNMSLRVPIFEAETFNPVLPKAAIRANKAFTFDENGDIIMTDAVTQEVIDSIKEAEATSVASAASASAAAATATTQAGLATTNGAAQVSLAAAQVSLATTVRQGAEAARDEAAALAASLDPATIARVADLAAVETGLMSLAMKQAVQAGDTDRSILMNGWLDPLTDAGQVALTGMEFQSGDTGYIQPTPAGSGVAVQNIVYAAQRGTNLKGSITTFTVDTANTSGHFDATAHAGVRAGTYLFLVKDGANYFPAVSSVTSGGTTANSVAFVGTLPVGVYSVTGVYALATTEAAGTYLWQLDATIGRAVNYAYAVDLPPFDATYWTAITGGSADAWTSRNPGGVVFGAVSFDGGVSYVIWNSPRWRGIVQNNTGTWRYYNPGTDQWVNATINDRLVAFSEALAVGGNGWSLTPYYGLYTTDILTGGVVTASCAKPAGSQANLVDNNTSTAWRSAAVGTALPAWVQYQLPSAKRAWKYRLNVTTYPAYSPHDWQFQGSNDNTNWTTLDTQSGQTWDAAGWKEYTIPEANRGSYLYYRLYITAGGQETNNYMWINEWEVYEEVAVTTSLPNITQAQWAQNYGFQAGTTTDVRFLAALRTTDKTLAPYIKSLTLNVNRTTANGVAEFNAFTAVDPDIGRAVFVMQAVDDITLDTDVKAWMKRGTGAYAQVPLVQDSAYDATRVLVRGELDMSATPGTATQLKLTTHNNKAVKVFQASNYFKSKA